MKPKLLIIIGLVLVGLAIAAFVMTRSGGVGDDEAVVVSRVEGPAVEKRFSTWDQFLDSDEHKSTRPHQIVFIGIDGGVWWYLNQLIEKGQLPNLARMKPERA